MIMRLRKIRLSHANFLLVPALFVTVLLTGSCIGAATLQATRPNGSLTIQCAAKTSSIEKADISVFRLYKGPSGIQAVVLNNANVEQEITVRFEELESASYDLYIEGSRLGTFDKAALEKGIPVRLRCGVLQEQRPIAQRIEHNCAKLLEPSMEPMPDPEWGTVKGALSNVRAWSNLADTRIRNSAATSILLNDPGSPVRTTMWTVTTAKETVEALSRYWTAISDERGILNTGIKSFQLRNSAIAAITPIDISASRANGAISVSFANRSEVALSGKIAALGISGSKPQKPVNFGPLPSGKTFNTVFKLTGKSAVANTETPRVQANIYVGDSSFVVTAPVAAK